MIDGRLHQLIQIIFYITWIIVGIAWLVNSPLAFG
jgi:hypothetical protein